MDAFNDYKHHCPNCKAIVGKSTPDDRDSERKKGLMVVIGVTIASIFLSIVVSVVNIRMAMSLMEENAGLCGKNVLIC